MKKLTAIVLIGVLLLGTLAGCASAGNPNEGYVPTGDALLMEGEDPESLEPEKEPQTLTLAYDTTRSMNPIIGNNLNNRVLFSLMYQGLFAVDSRNNPTPILCQTYQVSADNRTYTYYLEPDARFSDGTRVTAYDVLASYEAAKASNYYKGRFLHVYSAEVVDGDGGQGIKFILNTAYQDFSLLMDFPVVKASDVDAEHPIGSGPYTFTSSTSGAYLTRNPDWWCGIEIAARADSITLVDVRTQAELRDQFEFGDISLACTNPLSDSFAEFRCDYELWEVESGYFMYLTCNILYSDYFKDDDTLRKALTYAIDRETLVQENYRGMARPATLPASPGSPYYYDSLASRYQYDSIRFVQSIVGWDPPKDKDQPNKKLRLLVNSDDSARLRVAHDIAAALTEFGIPTGTLEYTMNTKTTVEQILRAGNFELYLGMTRLSPNMDLTPFFTAYGGLQYGGLPSDEIYTLCKETLADKGNYYNLEQKVAEDGRLIPILFGYNAVYAKRGVFENLQPSRDNVFYYSLGKTMTGAKMATVYD